MDRVRVDLNGPPQTMLATLYAKALDADAPRSILCDQYAKAAVERIDYAWATTTINARRAPSVAIRTDQAWLAEIPADNPALFLAEGLTMYLTKDDGLALLRRVVDRFPCGELQFDAFSTFGIRTQVINSVVRRSGSTLHWGSTGPVTSSMQLPECACWPGNRCSTATHSTWCRARCAGWEG